MTVDWKEKDLSKFDFSAVGFTAVVGLLAVCDIEISSHTCLLLVVYGRIKPAYLNTVTLCKMGENVVAFYLGRGAFAICPAAIASSY